MPIQASKAAVSGILALTVGVAHSQTAAPQATTSGGPQLEEVVVTARKVAENIQETPVSITAFSSGSIEKLGMVTITDIAMRTPGLNYGNFGDQKLSPTSLRGVVSSAGSAGQDPAVGVYVDDVFIGQGADAP